MVYANQPQAPCILFVDEKKSIREYAKCILEGEGFEVLTARNSLEALVLAADFPRQIDLLVTDPKRRVAQNGMELVSCFNILRPETQVISIRDQLLGAVTAMADEYHWSPGNREIPGA